MSCVLICAVAAAIFLFGWLVGAIASERALLDARAENIVLRQQLAVAVRNRPRLPINSLERFILGWFCRLWPKLLEFVVIVRPETVVRWHREGYCLFWKWKSRAKGGRPKIDRALIALIQRISRENPLWGAPRIHGELLKLAYAIVESTVAKYMVRVRGRGGGQTWSTFLRNHAREIAAIDMLTVPTLTFETLYAFVVLGHARRTILHIEVTSHPTALWLAQQLTEAFPWDSAPRFLVRDNDGAYGEAFRRRILALGVRDTPTSVRSPWQNAYVERVIGSIRRECLDHIIVLNEAHLHRVLRAYADYYNNDRTHLGLEKDSPNGRPVEGVGEITCHDVLGGLHHRYVRIPSG